MQRLKRAVYAYNEKMKVLEKLCTSENQMLSEVLTSKELNRISSSLPTWEENKQYATGSTAVYEGDVYKCLQAHTSNSAWIPKAAHTLWEYLPPECDGTQLDPTKAKAGLRYFKDKYYLEEDTLYLCIRDDTNEGTVLYNMPSELLENYFTVVTGKENEI